MYEMIPGNVNIHGQYVYIYVYINIYYVYVFIHVEDCRSAHVHKSAETKKVYSSII